MIVSSRGKDYLQINAFLASGSRVEKNFKALQIKTTASLSGGAIGEIPSSIESLGGSHCAEKWQEGWPTGRSKAGLSRRQYQLTH